MQGYLELLAPAKDLQCGISAINCGADAVYIGASAFGARAAAGNSLEDLKQLINYAHKYFAKVYITINTILTDDELTQAEELIHELYKIKADAIIIQDMGILELDLPPIQIFASTQCNTDSIEKVKFFENIGVKRVILPRELTLAEIKEVKANTNIDIECFIHGALCTSYSGQCYLSHSIDNRSGRSGNRGGCAQPCRKKYSLVDEDDTLIAEDLHLLSLKDLNLSNHISKLVEAGVTSFKIEGRLKNEAYIKNIVSFYRQKLDAIIENTEYKRTSSGQSLIDFEPNPHKTFNRGYSSYYLTGKRTNIASFYTPKSIGEKIGVVQKVGKDFIELENGKILNNADGICFFDSKRELKGALVNNVANNKVTLSDVKGITVNTVIFRNSDYNFNKLLEKTETKRKIDVNFEIFNKKEEIIFKMTDEDDISTEISVKNEFELANNKEKAIENIEKQLSKLGETEFSAKVITINLDNAPFIPVKELNEIRRTLAQKHIEQRLSKYAPITAKIEHNDTKYPIESLDYRANIMNEKAKEFYIKHGSQVEEMALESQKSFNNKVLMKTKHCLRDTFNMCLKNNEEEAKQLYIIDEKQVRYKLKFDCKNCVMRVCK